MEADLYSRQMKWRDDAKKKALENQNSNQEDPECTFEPKKYTKAPQKKFTGSAMEKGISTHVVRQAKARESKRESPAKSSYGKNSSLLPVEVIRESDENRTNVDLRSTPTPPSSPAQVPASSSSVAYMYGTSHDTVDTDGLDYTEESVVDMLERERREWQSDRVKLIHCIHLQQLELTQRAAASHEKATDIAKEFARAIEGFEERLVSVENNVHKEISAIKSIADTLLLSATMNQRKDEGAEMSPVEARVVHVEKCMEVIMERLGNISTCISSNK